MKIAFMKGRVNSENACCHSVQNILSFSLLAENTKNTISRKMGLPVLCGYKIWSLTLTKEHRLRLFENVMLRKVFGSKRDDVARTRRDCIVVLSDKGWSPSNFIYINSKMQRI
jgi:hypothetical protein